jgi:ferredoxin-NADP reductase
MPPPPRFEARLVRARSLSPSVRELAFERVDGTPMVFDPGQWVNVILPVAHEAARETKRSYSIASPPDDSPAFEIAVTRVQGGVASNWLHSVELGAVLPFTGPQGFFTRSPATEAPALMIATGTGVTPMRSMMTAAAIAGSRGPMWLLLGVRREEDLLYADELTAMAREHRFVRFEATLSQPSPRWSGRRGYVQTHVPQLWADLVRCSTSTPHAYVCGLQRMVGSVRELLRNELALTREQVHSERYD